MAGFEGFPLIVGWELTLACNLRCEHCGSTAGQPRPVELTTAEALDVCDQLPDLLVREVDFTGGEPLVRADWLEIAQRLHELGINTKLITNGVLLGKENVSRLKESGVERVGVSLDGLEQTHDALRARSGLFQRVIRGIERLLEAGVPVTPMTTLTSQNVGQLPSIHSLLRSLGVDFWQVQPIFPLGRAADFGNLRLSEADYLRIGEFAESLFAAGPESPPCLIPGDSFGYYTRYDKRTPAWGGCSAGLVLCGICSDGQVKGCLSMPDSFVEGDLRERDLWDIWFDANAFQYNRRFSEKDLGPNCRGCEMAAKCRGGCSSMSYACTGSMHNDPYCFLGMENRHAKQATDITLAHLCPEPEVRRFAKV